MNNDGSGMENKDSKTRLARIPPRWQLQLFVEPQIGFLRMEVSASTTVGEVRAEAARLASEKAIAKGWGEPQPRGGQVCC